MAGRGPAPKDPARRARTNSDPMGIRVITATPVEQPALPEFDLSIDDDGQVQAQNFCWTERTRTWWRMWASSPLSKDFTETDWSELLDTALIHNRFWLGDLRLAGELRLRVAKFGATPEDRARLRIQFATADEVESRAKPRVTGSSSRTRRGPLRDAG